MLKLLTKIACRAFPLPFQQIITQTINLFQAICSGITFCYVYTFSLYYKFNFTRRTINQVNVSKMRWLIALGQNAVDACSNVDFLSLLRNSFKKSLEHDKIIIIIARGLKFWGNKLARLFSFQYKGFLIDWPASCYQKDF